VGEACIAYWNSEEVIDEFVDFLLFDIDKFKTTLPPRLETPEPWAAIQDAANPNS
jgi:hypothetical protein